MRNGAGDRRGLSSAAVRIGILGLIVAAAAVPPARAADNPWGEDSHWVSVRVGTAGSGARLASSGSFGYGFSYTWFLSKQLAWSATAQHDVIGRYGAASEIDVPFTVEFTRHFGLSSIAEPYLGGGWGAAYHKTYLTGADESGFRQGIYLAVGGNGLVNAGNLIGVDFRLMLEQDSRTLNPTFPNSHAATRNWSLKLSYSRVL